MTKIGNEARFVPQGLTAKTPKRDETPEFNQSVGRASVNAPRTELVRAVQQRLDGNTTKQPAQYILRNAMMVDEMFNGDQRLSLEQEMEKQTMVKIVGDFGAKVDGCAIIDVKGGASDFEIEQISDFLFVNGLFFDAVQVKYFSLQSQ
jgi:hypothetical protein